MSFLSSISRKNSSLMNKGKASSSSDDSKKDTSTELEKISLDDIISETQELIENKVTKTLSFTSINLRQQLHHTQSNLTTIATKASSTSPTNSQKSSPKQPTNCPSQTSLSTQTTGSAGEEINKSSDSSIYTSGEFSKSLPSELPDKPKSASKLTERAKKKSWYSALYPSYKSRSEDFKKLFKDVPDDERLLVDYSCALQKDILIQGRLYVSQNYVCFYSYIFRWETCLSLKWKEVTALTKEKTARVIPNAISIGTHNEKHFFTSFTTRDKAFLMLFRVWQNALMDRPMKPQEIWQSVHNCYGEQLGLTSEDEDYIDPYADLEENTNSKKKPTTKTFEEFIGNDFELLLETVSDSRIDNKSTSTTTMDSSNSKNDDMKFIEGKRKINKNNRQRDELIMNKNSETLPTDMSDSSDSDENKNIPFVCTAECTSMHEGRQLVHTILPINVDKLFNMLFSKSKFLVDFHVARKSTGMNHGEWTVNEDGVKTRTVNVTVALTQAVGPKSSNVTETQIMRECSKPGELYSIDINSVNAGIPYAESFGVLLHYCLVKNVDDHTMLSVHAQIEYKKSIWGVVKGIIEKNTWAGLEEFFTALLRALQNEYCIPPAKSKARRSRRPTATARIIEETVNASVTNEPVKSNVPVTIKVLKEPTKNYKWLCSFNVVLLIGLLFLYIILSMKLYKLEQNDLDCVRVPNLEELKNLPNNPTEWIELLKQQEALHDTEMKKWQNILQTAIELLKKTEKTLTDLLVLNKCIVYSSDENLQDKII